MLLGAGEATTWDQTPEQRPARAALEASQSNRLRLREYYVSLGSPVTLHRVHHFHTQGRVMFTMRATNGGRASAKPCATDIVRGVWLRLLPRDKSNCCKGKTLEAVGNRRRKNAWI